MFFISGFDNLCRNGDASYKSIGQHTPGGSVSFLSWRVAQITHKQTCSSATPDSQPTLNGALCCIRDSRYTSTERLWVMSINQTPTVPYHGVQAPTVPYHDVQAPSAPCDDAHAPNEQQAQLGKYGERLADYPIRVSDYHASLMLIIQS